MPRYCSNACRQRAYRERHALPATMTRRRQWVRADGKRPVQLDGRPASSTDPSTWAHCVDVKAGPHGIMLGAGLGCYDLDHVTDVEARAFIATVAEPVVYVERSLSGEGVHVFVEAPEGPGWKRTVNGLSVERYTRERFIRVTGETFR